MDGKALVLFSGGQDSTTCLAWASSKFQVLETIGFHYGQRHAVEMDCRQSILKMLFYSKLGSDHVIDLREFFKDSKSAILAGGPMDHLTDRFRDEKYPASFLPGRNLVFLTSAAMIARQREIRHIVAGMCQTDFSGYPDCRDNAIKALQVAINIGMDWDLSIHTPLMFLTKAQTWEMALNVGGWTLIDVIRYESHTCYLGDRSVLHDWGYGCGKCDACRLRARGWDEFQR